MPVSIDELIAPIEGDNPSGADVAYEQICDDIKEARRADDPSLSQGDWKAELKVANWRMARELCVKVLAEQSKDLQVAGWLIEALGQLEGFAGLTDGFTVLERLMADFWDTLYPEAEDGDLDLRAGKIAWINKTLPMQVRFIPLTVEGEYGWHKWQESRDTDNLARKSAEAASAALDDGKISGEMFAAAVANSPASFYEERLAQVAGCKAALDALISRVDERFGGDAPSLMDLRGALEDCSKLLNRIASEKGILAGEGDLPEEAHEAGEIANGGGGASPGEPRSAGASGPIANRADALRRLAEVARYFRTAEPHSPVAYLVDRAVRWGEMSLDQWLAETVKDPAALDTLRETLGIRPESGGE